MVFHLRLVMSFKTKKEEIGERGEIIVVIERNTKKKRKNVKKMLTFN